MSDWMEIAEREMEYEAAQEWRQQAELEEERLRCELDKLQELERIGRHDLAVFFARELCITHEFQNRSYSHGQIRAGNGRG